MAELFDEGNEEEVGSDNEDEPDQNDYESDEEIERLLDFENSNVRITDDAREFLRCFKNTVTQSASNDD